VSAAGKDAERFAETFLQQRGLKLVERNYRCRFGEIDLIMRDRDCLVFIEVRLRSSPAFGGAVASINAAKRSKLIKAAQHYLACLDRVPVCRFDAVLLTGPEGAAVEWIQGAIEG
jgi:putative endonuclease